MNVEKVKLIIKNMELLVQSLKLEMEEEEKANVVKLEDLFTTNLKKEEEDFIDDYEPDYYEEP